VTDIDLMSETQIAVMTVLAVVLWTVVAYGWYVNRPRPKKHRATYRHPSNLHVDVSLGLPPKRRLKKQAKNN